MSLADLIAAADERALAATGLGCLDRCLPLLAGDDDVVRPLWASLTDGAGWPDRLAAVRAALKGAEESAAAAPDEQDPRGAARALVVRMLTGVPEDVSPGLAGSADDAAFRGIRAWADACSLDALHVHRLLDAAGDSPDAVAGCREGRTEGMSPLVAAELRRQTEILRLCAKHGAGALRQALEVTTDGRRVLRAVVSRRDRTG